MHSNRDLTCSTFEIQTLWIEAGPENDARLCEHTRLCEQTYHSKVKLYLLSLFIRFDGPCDPAAVEAAAAAEAMTGAEEGLLSVVAVAPASVFGAKASFDRR